MLLGLAQGFFNSLQFSSINAMAYADIERSRFEHGHVHREHDAAAVAELRAGVRARSIAGWYLGDVPQTDQLAVTTRAALHVPDRRRPDDAVVAVVLDAAPGDGDNVSRGREAPHDGDCRPGNIRLTPRLP